MARVLLSIVACSSLVSVATAVTCAAADNANCPTWIKSGFCDAYSPVTLAANCPKSCPKAGCGAVAAPTTGTNTSTATENANCKKWNEDPKNGFCATATVDQKKMFCKTTCVAEITPPAADDCAIYVSTSSKVKRTPSTKTATPGTAVKTLATATDMLLNVYAKDKCKVDLYAEEAPTVGTTAILKTYTGAGTTTFFKITVAAEQAAKSYVCTCTA